MTLTHLQKLPKNMRDLDKLIVSKGFKKLPKVQKIAQSGHTAQEREIAFQKIYFHFIFFSFPQRNILNLSRTPMAFK